MLFVPVAGDEITLNAIHLIFDLKYMPQEAKPTGTFLFMLPYVTRWFSFFFFFRSMTKFSLFHAMPLSVENLPSAAFRGKHEVSASLNIPKAWGPTAFSHSWTPRCLRRSFSNCFPSERQLGNILCFGAVLYESCWNKISLHLLYNYFF